MNASKLKLRPVGSRHPDWERLYAEEAVTQMPWYLGDLDPDLRRALRNQPALGKTFLDIGTGPGTQARVLARMGFEVVATDISRSAVRMASAQIPNVRFIEDDITRTSLVGKFNFVLDRGCFHVLEASAHADYVRNLGRLTQRGGCLFLKCFSSQEPPRDFGPLTFSSDEIEQLFRPRFKLVRAHTTRYHGEQGPQSLFCVLKRRD